MMKKQLTYIFLLVIYCFAGTGLLKAQTSSDAKSLLDKVSKQYRGYSTYYLEFTYSVLSKNGANSQSNGIVYARKDKYNATLSGINQIFDGKKLYNISSEDREVTISSARQSEDFITPSSLLRGYESGYKYKWLNHKFIDGKKIQFVKLIPLSIKDKSEWIIGINSKNKEIYQLKQQDGTGGQITFTVKEQINNLLLPPSIFSFDVQQYQERDYYITDLE